MEAYLFYSVNCEFCKKLMFVMKNQNLLYLFKLICIDELSPIELTTRGITQIPTIVLINKYGGKIQKQILEGANAGQWVENMINNRRNFVIQNTEKNRNAIQLQNLKAQKMDGISNYYIMETKGISDAYSYWNDEIKKEVQLPQPKSYVSPAHIDEKIITFIDDKEKLDTSTMSGKMNELKNVRSRDENEIKNVLERQQIEKVINST